MPDFEDDFMREVKAYADEITIPPLPVLDEKKKFYSDKDVIRFLSGIEEQAACVPGFCRSFVRKAVVAGNFREFKKLYENYKMKSKLEKLMAEAADAVMQAVYDDRTLSADWLRWDEIKKDEKAVKALFERTIGCLSSKTGVKTFDFAKDKPVTIRMEKSLDGHAYYSEKDRAIAISSEKVQNWSVDAAFGTLIHEMWHGYQHEKGMNTLLDLNFKYYVSSSELLDIGRSFGPDADTARGDSSSLAGDFYNIYRTQPVEKESSFFNDRFALKETLIKKEAKKDLRSDEVAKQAAAFFTLLDKNGKMKTVAFERHIGGKNDFVFRHAPAIRGEKNGQKLFENAFSALNEELREKKGVVSLERKGDIIYLSFSRCKNKEAAACLNRAAQKLKQSQNNAFIQKGLLSGRAGKG